MNAQDVDKAHALISKHINRTPVLTSRTFNELAGAELFFKCENMQKVGAFKARGALHAMQHLPPDTSRVITHSSGNHGAALAWAASLMNIDSVVVCPADSNPGKLESIERYGGRVMLCGPTISDREQSMREYLQRNTAHVVPPYDDWRIIAGQGTAAKELIEDIPELDQIWVPVGGGGLVAGTILAADGRLSVFGVEPELARDCHDSLNAGRILPPMPIATMADGLRSGIGQLNFEIMRQVNLHVELVSEQQIEEAMRLVWRILKVVIEPSSAVPVAAVLATRSSLDHRVGIILSGGNTSFHQG